MKMTGAVFGETTFKSWDVAEIECCFCNEKDVLGFNLFSKAEPALYVQANTIGRRL